MPVRIDVDPHQDHPGDVTEGDPDADADLRSEGDGGECPEDDAEHGQPGERDEATAARGVHQDGRRDAGRDPHDPAEQHPDDQRADARVDGKAERVADRRVQLVQQAEPEDDTDHDGDHERYEKGTAEASRGDTERAEHGGHRDRDEQQEAVEDAPAHRAEQPLPEPQRGPDDDQEDREDDQRDGQCAEGGHPPDFTRDLTGLGLGQFDVRHDEGHRGITSRLELIGETRRLRARPARRRGGRRRRGFGGRVRIVQGSAPGPVRARDGIR